ncbi:hypothetical protein PROFUN_05890 [Planoprotostelium fungivorum]|uniref:Enoyl reductase (ER) domain-containing protein n=1 Tax=Planoprotostelium fungivorum TaxID=1890364 RepID=A0A2P6NKQ5_9EUKA|nr:hypothetical protein PROFUN_05890 [Planoprotostelium fungivorum]
MSEEAPDGNNSSTPLSPELIQEINHHRILFRKRGLSIGGDDESMGPTNPLFHSHEQMPHFMLSPSQAEYPAYLEGLRGWAVLAIMFGHFSWLFYMPLWTTNDWIIEYTPFVTGIRGRTMLSLILLISGRLLLFPQIQSGRFERPTTTIIQKFINFSTLCFGTLLLTNLLWGAHGRKQPIIENLQTEFASDWLLVASEWVDRRSLFELPIITLRESIFFLSSIHAPSLPIPGGVSWIMPIHFWGAVSLYFLALLHLPRKQSIALPLFMMIASRIANHMISLFFTGYFFTLLYVNGTLPIRNPRIKRAYQVILAMVTFYSCLPDMEPIGFRFFNYFIMNQWWKFGNTDFDDYPSGTSNPKNYIKAVLIMLTLDEFPSLQRLFQTKFSRFIGNIYLPLYLTHGLALLWSVILWFDSWPEGQTITFHDTRWIIRGTGITLFLSSLLLAYVFKRVLMDPVDNLTNKIIAMVQDGNTSWKKVLTDVKGKRFQTREVVDGFVKVALFVPGVLLDGAQDAFYYLREVYTEARSSGMRLKERVSKLGLRTYGDESAIMSQHRSLGQLSKGSPTVTLLVDTPALSSGQILVRVEWLGVTPLSQWQHDFGLLVANYPLQSASGNAVGQVVAVGSDVRDELKIGTKVFGFSWASAAEKPGQELAVIHQVHVAKLPDNVSPIEAASVPDSFVTAWHAFTSDLKIELPIDGPHGKLEDGDEPILIWGGATSVGHYALQVLKYFGYNQVLTTASPRHHDRLRQLGATHTVDYNSPRWKEEVQTWLNGRRFRAALDCVGDEEFTVKPISQVMEAGSIVAVLLPVRLGGYGKTEGVAMETEVEFNEGVQVKGVRTHFYDKEPGPVRERLQPEVMPRLLSQGIIRPNSVRTVEGEDPPQRFERALDEIRGAKVSGEKLVISMTWPQPKETQQTS